MNVWLWALAIVLAVVGVAVVIVLGTISVADSLFGAKGCEYLRRLRK